MRLVFLGKLGALASPELCELARPDGVRSLADLKAWIGQVRPELGRAMAAMPVRVVVNHSVAHDLSASLGEGDEVAFLPPMSGG